MTYTYIWKSHIYGKVIVDMWKKSYLEKRNRQITYKKCEKVILHVYKSHITYICERNVEKSYYIDMKDVCQI